MSNHSSKKVIYAALVGNALISATKFGASIITSSSAMLSEAIHSLVDTGNQVLLLHGLRRAALPADDAHPFGYGKELYFWAFAVAILVFALGAGISAYEGIHRIMHPVPVSDAYINYIVLGLALVFEGAVWWVAVKEFIRLKGDAGVIEAIRESKDPTVITVLFEDSAAMLGLIAAFAGVAISDVFGLPIFDGIASLVIAFILAITAAFLAYECKGLLIGEGAHPGTIASIRAIISQDERILGINELLTIHFGPQDILLTVSLDFADGLKSEDLEAAVTFMEARIKTAHPEISRIFIEAQHCPELHASLQQELAAGGANPKS